MWKKEDGIGRDDTAYGHGCLRETGCVAPPGLRRVAFGWVEDVQDRKGSMIWARCDGRKVERR